MRIVTGRRGRVPRWRSCRCSPSQRQPPVRVRAEARGPARRRPDAQRLRDAVPERLDGGLKRILIARARGIRTPRIPYLDHVHVRGPRHDRHRRVSAIATACSRTRGSIAAAGRSVTCTEDRAQKNIGYFTAPAGGDSAVNLAAADVRRSRCGGSEARVWSRSRSRRRSAIMMAGHGGRRGHVARRARAWLGNVVGVAAAPVPSVKAFIDANPIDADFGKVWDRLLPLDALPDGRRRRRRSAAARMDGHIPARAARPTTPARAQEQWEMSPYADEYLARLAVALVDAEALGQRDDDGRAGRELLGARHPGTCVRPAQPGNPGHVPAARPDHRHAARRAGRQGGSRTLRGRARLGSWRGRHPRAGAVRGPGRRPPQQRADDVNRRRGHADRLRQRAPTSHGCRQTTCTSSRGCTRSCREIQPCCRRSSARFWRSRESRRCSGARSSPTRRASRIRGGARRRSATSRVGAAISGWRSSPGGCSGRRRHDTWVGEPYDQRVPVIVMGPGVKPGEYAEPATPADIAPTLAALAGIQLPSAEGHGAVRRSREVAAWLLALPRWPRLGMAAALPTRQTSRPRPRTTSPRACWRSCAGFPGARGDLRRGGGAGRAAPGRTGRRQHHAGLRPAGRPVPPGHRGGRPAGRLRRERAHEASSADRRRRPVSGDAGEYNC